MMEKVKISDFAEVITGGTPSTSNPEYWENGDIPWLQSGACQNCIITECNTFITKKGLDNSAAKMMKPESVLIALTGATTGKIGFLPFEASANQSVTGIQPNERFISKYLYYYLRGIRQKILDDSYGGAQKHISQGYVKNIEVPLGTIKEQQTIADVLERVDNLISFRQRQLQKLDDLIKARFVEMFGDPIENSLDLPTTRMDNRYFLKAGITTSADDIHGIMEDDYKFPCYGGNGIRGYVNKSSYEGTYPIIGRQGALCGNIQYATGKFHATEHAVLVTQLENDNPIWTFYMLKLMDLNRFHTGAAQPGLAVKTLNTVNVIVADKVQQDILRILSLRSTNQKLSCKKHWMRRSFFLTA